MLLFITASGDATADLLISQFKKPVFRFNLDIYDEYKFNFDPFRWEIVNPTGSKINNTTASRCVWWKAFLSLSDEDQYIRSEVRYVANELYSWFRHKGLIIGNAPNTDESLGKVRQSSIASKYFSIPEQIVVWGTGLRDQFSEEKSWVVKSLSSQLTSDRHALFTTEVKISNLDPKYPWYVQQKIISEHDVTVLVVGRKYFAFSRDRTKSDTLDWRSEIFSESTPWTNFTLSECDQINLGKMLDEMCISWGRIDFLDTTDGLVFLEINLNGQWGFLDIENKYGIHNAVSDFFENGTTHD